MFLAGVPFLLFAEFIKIRYELIYDRMNAEAAAISSGRESRKYKHRDNEERDSPKLRTAEGAAAEMNSLGVGWHPLVCVIG